MSLPGEKILDPQFWKERLQDAIKTKEIHHAVFHCPIDYWKEIELKHSEILEATLPDKCSILDIGCGWGRLISLLPPEKKVRYAGIDLSPEFINMAHQMFPEHTFYLGELCDVIEQLKLIVHDKFDFAVMVSFRPMIKRNLGEDVWDTYLEHIKRVSRQQLYLEYDPKCDSFLES